MQLERSGHSDVQQTPTGFISETPNRQHPPLISGKIRGKGLDRTGVRIPAGIRMTDIGEDS